MDSAFDRNQEATCYVGDLDGQVDEALLWELCVQVSTDCVSFAVPWKRTALSCTSHYATKLHRITRRSDPTIKRTAAFIHRARCAVLKAVRQTLRVHECDDFVRLRAIFAVCIEYERSIRQAT
eukprot:6173330-Pleurochrysis_carterae.AAC.1